MPRSWRGGRHFRPKSRGRSRTATVAVCTDLYGNPWDLIELEPARRSDLIEGQVGASRRTGTAPQPPQGSALHDGIAERYA